MCFTIKFGFIMQGCVGRLEDNLVLIGSVGGALGVVFGILEVRMHNFKIIVGYN